MKKDKTIINAIIILILFLALVFIIIFFLLSNNIYKNKNNDTISKTIETNISETKNNQSNIEEDIISNELMDMVNLLKKEYKSNNMKRLSSIDLEMLTGITTNLYMEYYGEINNETKDILFIFKETEDNDLKSKLNTKLLLFKDYLYNTNIDSKYLNKINSLNIISFNGYCFYFVLNDSNDTNDTNYNILHKKGIDALLNYLNN